jgi:glycosyltransferase involved in cell wall biosynthesis
MRVLLVDPSDRGGIRAYTDMVADGLASAGADVEVLTVRGADGSARVLARLPVQSWGRPAGAGARFLAGRAVAWFASARTVVRTVRERQPDVVHFQAGFNRRFDKLLLRRLRSRVTVAWTAHDVLPFERTPADERRFAGIYRAADVVIVHNEPAAAAVRELAGVDAVVVRHPLPARLQSEGKDAARRRLGLPVGGRLLVAAGFVRPYKGYDLLADVWESLGAGAPRLLVVGEALGPEGEAVLERLARMPNVIVRNGFVPDDEFRLALEAADAALLPYSEASDSGVLHLARASSVPVLAADVPQLAAVVEETQAGRVLPRTLDAWRAAVVGELPPPPPEGERTAASVGADHLAAYRRLHLLAYTDATEVGGAELVLGALLRSLDPDIDVTVGGVDKHVVETVAAQRPRARTTLLRPVRGKFDALRILEHVRRVWALRPDVMHAHLRHPWSCQYGILAGVLAPGVAVVAVEVATLHTTSAVQRRLKRWTSRRLAAHVAVGQRSARMVEEAAGLPAGSIRTIYLGVEDHGVPPRRERDRFRAGYVGRLSPEKGVSDLIRALPLLPDTELVVVGDGPERSSLAELANELGVDDRITFTGWRDDARAAFADFDVLVLPSSSEGLPLVLVEAMLAELPVVATDVGSVPEAVSDGETGVLLAPGSPPAIAAALERLRDDPGLRVRMGKAGRREALQRFSPEAAARAFAQLYEEVRR